MAYADYNYYTTVYKGTLVPSSDIFDQVSQRASEYLNYITQGQSTVQLAEYPEEIKMACCAVAEDYYLNSDSDDKQHVTSESVGSYSVSYDRSVHTTNKRRTNKAVIYLGNTGLMYTGVY